MSKFFDNSIGIGISLVGILVALLLVIGISIFFAIPVWLLWNWLMPIIFGVTNVSLVQAWGLTLLCSLLFSRIQFQVTRNIKH